MKKSFGAISIVLSSLGQPTGMFLDWWLGIEGIAYLRERDIRLLIARHGASGGELGDWKQLERRIFSI